MRRTCALLTALCVLLCCALTGCGDDGVGAGFLLPINREPLQLDPQSAADASSVTVISALFEGLTRLDADGTPVAGAATWTVSDDGLTYTFTLRESYWCTISIRGEQTAWDEPTRVVADDFLFGMQRAVSPDNQSGTAAQFYGIQNAEAIHKGQKTADTLGVRAVNDSTLAITLTEADETFPARLATSPFMPCQRAFFQYTSGRYGLEKQYVLSNGAFSLTAWNHDHSLLLNKNKGYHAADGVAPSAVRFLIGTQTSSDALTDGTLDAGFLSAADVNTARQNGVHVMSLEDSLRGVYFNTAVPVLSNADVRRALRDSIEWQSVYDYLASIGESKATGYIPPDAVVGDEPYRNGANAVTYSTQLQTAQTALGKGLASVYPEEKIPSVPTLTVLAIQEDTSANLARYIIQSWQKNLKIYCSLELVSEETLTARMNSGNYQIALHTAIGGGLTAAQNLTAYTTGAANNLSAFSDADFDAACAVALRGGRNAVTAAENKLRECCPVIPLGFPHRYYGIADGCEGITVRPFGGGTYGGAYEFLQAKKWDQ